MSSLPRQIPVVLCLVCGLSSGCAVTRKSASYDSGSRMPWFGLELARPQRAPAPETHRIRLEGSIPLEPKPAKLMLSKPRKPASKKLVKREAAEVRGSIAIPRTDLADKPEAKSVNISLTEEIRQLEF